MIITLKKRILLIAAILLVIFLLINTQSCKSDLIVKITSPETVSPGNSPGTVSVEVSNVGHKKALGTQSLDKDGYMVDIVLSKDHHLPVQWATISDIFKEDMLLLGGRISNTTDLASGESKTYTLSAPSLLIPEDTPPGEYCIGAVIDPGMKIIESNENNNTSCSALKVNQLEEGTTTVFIVRHAERSNDALTVDGENRAETLARILERSGVSVVLSTNTIRTRETINNYADPRQIVIQMYSTPEEVSNLIRSEYFGNSILVAGHSNTVPNILEGLGISNAPQIYNEYNNLFIVSICPDGTSSLIHLKYEIHSDL